MGQGLIILICSLPTFWEVYNDRNGETKRDKQRDAMITMGLYMAIALALIHYVEVHKSLTLMLAIRLLIFDYVIHYVLIRRGVIRGHWFTYVGKTPEFDQLVRKINPWVRLAIRVVVFVGGVLLLVSCGPASKLRRAERLIHKAELQGAVWRSDTAYVQDTVIITGTRVDSLFVPIPGDTVIIQNERLRVKYVRLPGDTVYISGESLPDTVVRTVPVAVTKEIHAESAFRWWWLVVAAVLGGVALRIIMR